MIDFLCINDIDNLNEIYYKFTNYRLNKENIKDNLNKFLVYKNQESSIIAFLEYANYYERSEINNIYVDENYRNKGIATKLLGMYIEICIKSNIENITLEVNESNIAAINLYKKNGFIEAAYRKNYYGANDGILMLKELR